MATVGGLSFDVINTSRRDGDAAVLIADSTKLRKELCWKPQYDDLHKIVRDALAWERANS